MKEPYIIYHGGGFVPHYNYYLAYHGTEFFLFENQGLEWEHDKELIQLLAKRKLVLMRVQQVEDMEIVQGRVML